MGMGQSSPLASRMLLTDAFVVGAIHESAQRRKAAAQQQLKIAKLACAEVP